MDRLGQAPSAGRLLRHLLVAAVGVTCLSLAAHSSTFVKHSDKAESLIYRYVDLLDSQDGDRIEKLMELQKDVLSHNDHYRETASKSEIRNLAFLGLATLSTEIKWLQESPGAEDSDIADLIATYLEGLKSHCKDGNQQACTDWYYFHLERSPTSLGAATLDNSGATEFLHMAQGVYTSDFLFAYADQLGASQKKGLAEAVRQLATRRGPRRGWLHHFRSHIKPHMAHLFDGTQRSHPNDELEALGEKLTQSSKAVKQALKGLLHHIGSLELVRQFYIKCFISMRSARLQDDPSCKVIRRWLEMLNDMLSKPPLYRIKCLWKRDAKEALRVLAENLGFEAQDLTIARFWDALPFHVNYEKDDVDFKKILATFQTSMP